MQVLEPFIRELLVKISLQDKIIEIKSTGDQKTLKVTANISKTIMGIPNPSQITITNLSKDTRNAIRKGLSKIEVYAGWRNVESALVFRGNVISNISERNGADIITKLSALQGGTALSTSVTSKTYAAGTPINEVVKDMASNLEGITIDETYIKDIKGNLDSGGFSYAGSTKDGLTQLANEYGFSWHIDDDAFKAVSDKSKLSGLIEVDGANGGLINITPVLTGPLQQQTGVKIKTFYIPGINAGSSIKVKSSLDEGLNGEYRIHTANISLDPSSNTWFADIESFNYL